MFTPAIRATILSIHGPTLVTGICAMRSVYFYYVVASVGFIGLCLQQRTKGQKTRRARCPRQNEPAL
jgi:hypothetical protein